MESTISTENKYHMAFTYENYGRIFRHLGDILYTKQGVYQDIYNMRFCINKIVQWSLTR